jgi:hypothetical protein
MYDTGQSFPSSAQVRNEWSHVSKPPFAFMTGTQKTISYDTAVPEKTKFISLLHERQTERERDRET